MSNSRNLGWSGGIHSAAVQDGVLTGHSSSITLNCQSTTVGNLAVGMVKNTGAESQVGDLTCDSVYTTGKGVRSSVGSRKRLPRTAGLEQVDSDAAMGDLGECESCGSLDYLSEDLVSKKKRPRKKKIRKIDSDSEEGGLGLAGGARLGELGASLDYCRIIDKIRKCLVTVESDRKKSSSLKRTVSGSIKRCIADVTKSLQELVERHRSGRTDPSVEERTSCLRCELLALEAKNSVLQDEIAQLKAAARKEEKKMVKNDQSGSAAGPVRGTVAARVGQKCAVVNSVDLSRRLVSVREAEPLSLAQLYEGFGQLTNIVRDLVDCLKTRGRTDVTATYTTGSGALGS
ncbi:hypothetical protein M0802_012730 [Mischocyttarus mexicanus]|nr:hypothetical protein M0802_012730 [Mischocyttarus mexicanus]